MRRSLLAFACILQGQFAFPLHAETIQIVVDKMNYVPAEAKASVGDTIEWVNKDIFSHTVTARKGEWDIVVASKATKTLEATTAGTIEYYCRFHPNMKGVIVVAPRP